MNKLRKTPSDSLTFYIAFNLLLRPGELLTSFTPITVAPTTVPPITPLALSSEQINSSNIGTILPGQAVQFVAAQGTDGYEYVLETTGNTNQGNSYDVQAVLLDVTTSDLIIDYYGNVQRATTYFNQRVDNSAWASATNPQQRNALFTATQMIERLNFKGTKADPNQNLEFPRQGNILVPSPDPYSLEPTVNMQVYITVIDIDIPKAIEYACYELAYQLLDGVDQEKEAERLVQIESRYASVRSTYDRRHAPEHIAAGIPSFRAWTYLKPYLRETRGVTLSRVN